MELMESLKAQIEGKNVRIVLPEGKEPRILEAASRLHKEGILVPVLVGSVDAIKAVAAEKNIDIEGVEIVDPANYDEFDAMVDSFVERRKGKATVEDAKKKLLDENYFGTMLTYMGKVDGMVSGAVHSTGDTVRPALQIIKTKPGVSRTSGAFVMMKDDTRYIFGDCAINIELDAEGLAGGCSRKCKDCKNVWNRPKGCYVKFLN